MGTATAIGISPLEFWEITPYELQKAVEGHKIKESNEISLAYMQAYWTARWNNGKKVESLENILKKQESEIDVKKRMSDQEMLNRVKVLHKVFGGE